MYVLSTLTWFLEHKPHPVMRLQIVTKSNLEHKQQPPTDTACSERCAVAAATESIAPLSTMGKWPVPPAPYLTFQDEVN